MAADFLDKKGLGFVYKGLGCIHDATIFVSTSVNIKPSKEP